jgi:hypothetical protein
MSLITTCMPLNSNNLILNEIVIILTTNGIFLFILKQLRVRILK